MTRALSHFPFPAMVQRILGRYLTASAETALRYEKGEGVAFNHVVLKVSTTLFVDDPKRETNFRRWRWSLDNLLGNLDFPGLAGPQANTVLVKMIAAYAPGAMAGMLAAGVFAAVMSSLDSQVLSLSTMFTRDVVNHYGFSDRLGDRKSVLFGRLFVGGIFAVTLALALTVDRSLFKLGIWSFTGFAALTPVIVAALYWKRSTRAGALAAILTTAALWIYFFGKGWNDPGYTVLGAGIMPVAVILAASSGAMVIGSLLTAPPSDDHLARFFG